MLFSWSIVNPFKVKNIFRDRHSSRMLLWFRSSVVMSYEKTTVITGALTRLYFGHTSCVLKPPLPSHHSNYTLIKVMARVKFMVSADCLSVLYSIRVITRPPILHSVRYAKTIPLTHSYAWRSWPVVWTCHTFADNFRMQRTFDNLLKRSCR